MTALSACVDLAPPYQRPMAPVPDAWPARSPSRAADATDAPEIGWTDVVHDERLRRLIRLALDNNRDLRIALLRVQEARAQYRIHDAAAGPRVSLDAGATRTSTTGVTSNTLSADIGLAAYEIDLFGRVKNANAAALQDYLATAEGARAARIAVVAAVASAWLTLRADDATQRLNVETLALQATGVALNRRMLALGAIPALPLEQAQAAWESARGAVAAGRATLQQDRDALALLVGVQSSEPWLPPPAPAGDPAALVDVPATLPATVLQQRPDVRAAEHQLQAAQLEIGVARAAWFPTISLSLGAGRAGTGLASLFKAGAGTWHVGPSISLPLLDRGALDAGLDAARAQQEIALAAYEKTLQAAFAEVADALAVRATLAERLRAQSAQVQASELALRDADTLYRHGATSYLQVLEAQRSLHGAQQAHIALDLLEQQNRIALYKALGGGWKEPN